MRWQEQVFAGGAPPLFASAGACTGAGMGTISGTGMVGVRLEIQGRGIAKHSWAEAMRGV